MSGQFQNPFESIESAHDFLRLLHEEVLEAKQEIAADLQRELALPASRRRDALQVASYGLEKLDAHVIRSRRILNDLRSIRRLLFAERISTRQVQAIVARPNQMNVADQPAWVQRSQKTLDVRPASSSRAADSRKAVAAA